MLSERDIITIPIEPWEVERCKARAIAASIGGRSNIRSGADRIGNLTTDQIVGQLAQYAGCKWWAGTLGQSVYEIMRWYADLNPRQGDGGFDLPGSQTDFKGSLVRREIADRHELLRYNLPVRPHERHADAVYVLILIQKAEVGALAHLIGWAHDRDLPVAMTSGPFEGAHVIQAPHLNRLIPFRWNLNVSAPAIDRAV